MDPILELEIIERLKQKFTDFDIDFDKFCELLILNNAFLSGSFLLQAIQNRFFEGEEYDVDIFTFGTENISFEKDIQALITNAIRKKEFVKKILKDEEFTKENFRPCADKVTIINKYKGINKCLNNSLEIKPKDFYGFDKITNVVDFESTKKMLCKHQLIYYDDKIYKIPEDIVDNFDFDFCANYFNGTNIYIKNHDSIKSASCTLKLKQHRIYNNENRRIVKYINRGYHINVKFSDDIYEIVYLDLDKDGKLKPVLKNAPDTKNLIIICRNNIISIDDYLNNLSSDLKKIVIYTYPSETIINNLPSSVQELRLYIWKVGTGCPKQDTSSMTRAERKEYYRINDTEIPEMLIEKYEISVKNAIKNIKKVPFDCKIFINDVEHYF
jgi:hypothetical protein